MRKAFDMPSIHVKKKKCRSMCICRVYVGSWLAFFFFFFFSFFMNVRLCLRNLNKISESPNMWYGAKRSLSVLLRDLDVLPKYYTLRLYSVRSFSFLSTHTLSLPRMHIIRQAIAMAFDSIPFHFVPYIHSNRFSNCSIQFSRLKFSMTKMGNAIWNVL